MVARERFISGRTLTVCGNPNTRWRGGWGEGRTRVCSPARIGYSSVRTPRTMTAAVSLAGWHADVAQLVEHHLAKVRVAGSNPVVRSETPNAVGSDLRLSGSMASLLRWSFGRRKGFRGGVAEWFRQGPAKPCTRVRFPSPPLLAGWPSVVCWAGGLRSCLGRMASRLRLSWPDDLRSCLGPGGLRSTRFARLARSSPWWRTDIGADQVKQPQLMTTQTCNFRDQGLCHLVKRVDQSAWGNFGLTGPA